MTTRILGCQMITSDVVFPLEKIAEVCKKYQVEELAVFGSLLRQDFHAESDVDLLVNFAPGADVTLFEFCAFRNELSDVVGRRVDLVSRGGLKPRLRDAILHEMQVIYAA